MANMFWLQDKRQLEKEEQIKQDQLHAQRYRKLKALLQKRGYVITSIKEDFDGASYRPSPSQMASIIGCRS
jgi:hypothetical protein